MANAVKYLANVAKSVKYASVDAFKEMNPVVSSFIDTNEDVAKEVYSTIKNFKALAAGQATSLKDGELGKTVKTGLVNLYDDLKHGTWYNKERISKAEDDSVKSMLSFGGDDDDWEIDTSASSSDSDLGFSDAMDDSDEFLANSMDTVGERTSTAISNAVVRSADYQVEASKQMFAKNIAHQNAIFGKMHGDLTAINTNMANVLKFNTESMSTHIKNSTTFYETQTQLMQEHNAMMKELLDLVKTRFNAKSNDLTSNRRITVHDTIDSAGNINIQSYIDYVKQNLKSQDSGMGDMLKLAKEMGLHNQLVASPLALILPQVVKAATSATLKNAMTEFNETLGSVFSNALIKVTGLKGDWDRPFLQKIGEVFGINEGIKTNISTSGYNKGAVQWNGKSEKALTEVIPTLLSKIYSAVSNSSEMRYDYNSGTFKSLRTIKNDFDNIKQNSTRTSASEVYYDLSSLKARNLKFKNSDQESQFDKDLMKVLEYNMMNLQTFNRKSDRQSAETYGISKESLQMIEYLWDKLPKTKRMKYANNLISVRSTHNRQMEDIESDGTSVYHALFNGSTDFGDTTGADSKKSNVKMRRKYEAPIEYLYLINKNIEYIRSYGLTTYPQFDDDNNGGGGPTNPTGPKPPKQTLFTKVGNAIGSRKRQKPASPVKTKTKVRRKNPNFDEFLQADAANYVEPEKEAPTIDIVESNYFNSKKALEKESEGFLDKLTNATNITSKFKVIFGGLDKLVKSPGTFLAGVLHKADERIYDLLYGERENGDSVIKTLTKNMNKWFDESIQHIKTSFATLKMKFEKDNIKAFFKKAADAFGLTKLKDKLTGEGGIFEGFGKNVKDTFKSTAASGKQFVKDSFDEAADFLGIGKTKEFKERTKKQAEHNAKVQKDKNDALEKLKEEFANDNIDLKAEGERKVKRTGLAILSKGEKIVPPDYDLQHIKERYTQESKIRSNIAKLIGGKNVALYAEGNGNEGIDQESIKKAQYEKIIKRGPKYVADYVSKLARSGKSKAKAGFTAFLNQYKEDHPEFAQQLRQIYRQQEYDRRRKKIEDDAAANTVDIDKATAEDYRNGNGGFFNQMKETIKVAVTTGAAKGFMDDIKEEAKSIYTDAKEATAKDGKFKTALDDVMKNIKQYLPGMTVGGLIGAGTSLITGAIGGPLLGAAAGAAISIAKNSNTVQEWLFGPEVLNEDGSSNGRAGGIISRSIQQNFKKYFPTMAKGGTVGAITSLLPIVPGGPVAGLIVGSAAGFAIENDQMRKALFGSDTSYEDIKKKMQKMAPKMGIGAAVGLLTGPFGMATNMILGSALGIVADSNAFKDALFGKEDFNGERHGGIAGKIAGMIKPVSTFITEELEKLKTWGKTKVLDPIANAITPLMNQVRVMVTSIGDFVKERFNKAVIHPVRDMILHSAMGKIIAPVVKGLAKLPITLAKAPFTAVAGAIGAAGTHFREKDVARGTATYMTAKERKDFRDKQKYDENGNLKMFGTGGFRKRSIRGLIKGGFTPSNIIFGADNDKFEKFDEMLIGMNTDEKRELLNQLQYAAANDPSEAKKIVTHNQKEMYDKIKAYNTGNYKAGEKVSDKLELQLAKAIKKGDKDAALAAIEGSDLNEAMKQNWTRLINTNMDRISQAQDASKNNSKVFEEQRASLEKKLGINGKLKPKDFKRMLLNTENELKVTEDDSFESVTMDDIEKEQRDKEQEERKENIKKFLKSFEEVKANIAKIADVTEPATEEIKESLDKVAEAVPEATKQLDNIQDATVTLSANAPATKQQKRLLKDFKIKQAPKATVVTATDSKGRILRYNKKADGSTVIDNSDSETKGVLQQQQEEEEVQTGIRDKLGGIANGFSSFFNFFKKDDTGEKKEGIFSKILKFFTGGGGAILAKLGIGLAGAGIIGGVLGKEVTQTDENGNTTTTTVGDIIGEKFKTLMWGANYKQGERGGIAGWFLDTALPSLQNGLKLVFFGKDGTFDANGGIAGAVIGAIPFIVNGFADLVGNYLLPGATKGMEWVCSTVIPVALKILVSNIPNMLSGVIEGLGLLIDGITGKNTNIDAKDYVDNAGFGESGTGALSGSFNLGVVTPTFNYKDYPTIDYTKTGSTWGDSASLSYRSSSSTLFTQKNQTGGSTETMTGGSLYQGTEAGAIDTSKVEQINSFTNKSKAGDTVINGDQSGSNTGTKSVVYGTDRKAFGGFFNFLGGNGYKISTNTMPWDKYSEELDNKTIEALPAYAALTDSEKRKVKPQIEAVWNRPIKLDSGQTATVKDILQNGIMIAEYGRVNGQNDQVTGFNVFDYPDICYSKLGIDASLTSDEINAYTHEKTGGPTTMEDRMWKQAGRTFLSGGEFTATHRAASAASKGLKAMGKLPVVGKWFKGARKGAKFFAAPVTVAEKPGMALDNFLSTNGDNLIAKFAARGGNTEVLQDVSDRLAQKAANGTITTKGKELATGVDSILDYMAGNSNTVATSGKILEGVETAGGTVTNNKLLDKAMKSSNEKIKYQKDTLFNRAKNKFKGVDNYTVKDATEKTPWYKKLKDKITGKGAKNAAAEATEDAADSALKGSLGAAAKNAAEDVTENAAREAVEEAAQKSAIKASGAITASISKADQGLISSAIAKISSKISEFLNNSTVFSFLQSKGGNLVSKLTATSWKSTVEELVEKITKKMTEKGLKNASKIVSKIGSTVAKVTPIGVIFAVGDLLSGFNNANTILGLTEMPNIAIRIVVGIFNALYNLIPLLPIFIDLSTLIDLGWGALKIFFPSLESTNFEEKRKAAQAEVEAYNIATGTHYSLEEYNNKDKISTKLKNGVKQLWSGKDKVDENGNVVTDENGKVVKEGGIWNTIKKGASALWNGTTVKDKDGNVRKDKDGNEIRVGGAKQTIDFVKNKATSIWDTISGNKENGTDRKPKSMADVAVTAAKWTGGKIANGAKNLWNKFTGKSDEEENTDETEVADSNTKKKSRFGNIFSNLKSKLTGKSSDDKTSSVSSGQGVISTQNNNLINTTYKNVNKSIPGAIKQLSAKLSSSFGLFTTKSNGEVSDTQDFNKAAQKSKSQTKKDLQSTKAAKFTSSSNSLWDKLKTKSKTLFTSVDKNIDKIVGYADINIANMLGFGTDTKFTDLVKKNKSKIFTFNSSTTSTSARSTSLETVSAIKDAADTLVNNSSKVSSSLSSGTTAGLNSLAAGNSGLKNYNYAGMGSGVTTVGNKKPNETETFVSQRSSKYANRRFATVGDSPNTTVADAGCAPAVATMAVNATTGKGMTMDAAMRSAIKYKLPGGGVTADYFAKQFEQEGLGAAYISNRSSSMKSDVKTMLSADRPVVLMGQDGSNKSKQNSPYGPNSHYVLATGMSKDGRTIYINDPEANKANLKYNADKVLSHSQIGIAPVNKKISVGDNAYAYYSQYQGRKAVSKAQGSTQSSSRFPTLSGNKTTTANFPVLPTPTQTTTKSSGQTTHSSGTIPSKTSSGSTHNSGKITSPSTRVNQQKQYGNKLGNILNQKLNDDINQYNTTKSSKSQQSTTYYSPGAYNPTNGTYNPSATYDTGDYSSSGDYSGEMSTDVTTTNEVSSDATYSLSNYNGKYGSDSVEYYVWSVVRAAGYSEYATAGVMGTVYCECGFQPTAIEKTSSPLKGYGLLQFTGANRDYLEQWCSARNRDPSTKEAQMQYFLESIDPNNRNSSDALLNKLANWYYSCSYKGYNREMWVNGTSPEDCAIAFVWWYGRPANDSTITKRQRKAREYYEEFAGSSVNVTGGSSSSSTGSSSGDGTWKLPKIVTDLYTIFDDLAAAYGLSSSSSSSDSSSGTSTVKGVYGQVSSNSQYAQKQVAMVQAMKNLQGKLNYSNTNRYDFSDNGSADCSSTVQHIYKEVLGVDPGGWTGAMETSNQMYTVDSGKLQKDRPDEANLQLGDMILYGNNAYDHVEMYTGDDQIMGHGGPGKGPNPKQLSKYKHSKGYWSSKRYIGFKDAGTTRITDTDSNIDSSSESWGWPLPSEYKNISSTFGRRNCPFHGWESHNGIDIPAPAGTPVYASKSGKVESAGFDNSFGNNIWLSHSGGNKTQYNHMSELLVSSGQSVKKGDTIGRVGTTGSSTGNHLDFRIKTANGYVNPSDYAGKGSGLLASMGNKIAAVNRSSRRAKNNNRVPIVLSGQGSGLTGGSTTAPIKLTTPSMRQSARTQSSTQAMNTRTSSRSTSKSASLNAEWMSVLLKLLGNVVENTASIKDIASLVMQLVGNSGSSKQSSVTPAVLVSSLSQSSQPTEDEELMKLIKSVEMIAKQ